MTFMSQNPKHTTTTMAMYERLDNSQQNEMTMFASKQHRVQSSMQEREGSQQQHKQSNRLSGIDVGHHRCQHQPHQGSNHNNMSSFMVVKLITILALFGLIECDQDAADLLMYQDYSGYFMVNTVGDQPPFSYLDSLSPNPNTNSILAFFTNDPLKEAPTPSSINTFTLLLFNPLYRDGRVVELIMPLGKIGDGERWEATGIQGTVYKYWKGKMVADETYFPLAYNLTLLNSDLRNPSLYSLNLQLSSISFSLQTHLQVQSTSTSTMLYCFFITAIISIQIISAWKMMKQLGVVQKMSMITVVMCTIQDFYQAMIHIQEIMAGFTHLLYIFPSIAYVILFVIFDMKLLFLVWRNQNLRGVQPGAMEPAVIRRRLTVFYVQFYFALFAYIALSYFFSMQQWLILLQNLFLIPQLVHNIRKSINPGFSGWYLGGFLGTRILLTVYRRGCPHNHFLLTPMPSLISVLVGIYLLQVLLLYLQSYYGPLFFVPECMRKGYYRYRINLKRDQQNSDLECTICLNSVFQSPDAEVPNYDNGINISDNYKTNHDNQTTNNTNQSNQYSHNKYNPSLLSSTLQNHPASQIQSRGTSSSLSTPLLLPQPQSAILMRTPCDHYFHSQCLLSWLDVKLECPKCRRQLPPMVERWRT